MEGSMKMMSWSRYRCLSWSIPRAARQRPAMTGRKIRRPSSNHAGASRSSSAAAWRFLGVRSSEPAPTTLDEFCALPGRIRRIGNDAELMTLEDEIDTMLRAHLKKSVDQDENASETQALIAAAHRIDNLIHHRRLTLKADASVTTGRYPVSGSDARGRQLASAYGVAARSQSGSVRDNNR
jgi:hypothetical protein